MANTGSNFEITMGQLADAEVSQNAPMLSEYKVGFQLLEKDKDDTRGCGVCVYDLNSQWVYVPVFFVNSRLTGTELMLFPAINQFMPCKEGWINYIKNKKAILLGKTVPKEGIKGGPGSAMLTSTSSLPFTKTAMDLDTDSLFQEADGLGRNMFDLKKWIPMLGKEAAASVAVSAVRDPDFANALLRFYSPDDIKGMMDVPAPMRKTASAPANRDVRIYRGLTKEAADNLGEEEKKVLAKDGDFVKDNRRSTSDVFKMTEGSGSLTTPAGSGVYDILMADGTFKKYLVLFPVVCEVEERYCCPGEEKTTALRPEKNSSMALMSMDKPTYFIRGNCTVLGKRADNMDPAVLKKAVADAGVSMDRAFKTRHRKILILQGDGEGYLLDTGRFVMSGNVMTFDHNSPVKKLVFTEAPGKLTRSEGTLYVPNGCRLVDDLEHAFLNIDDWDAREDRITQERQKHVFGDVGTVSNIKALSKEAGYIPLGIRSQGDLFDVSIDGHCWNATRGELMDHLVLWHGVAGPLAKHMIKEASEKDCEWLIKYAEDYPAFAEDENTEESDVVGGDIISGRDAVVRASDAGVKDVMDVTVLKSLARTGNIASSLRKYTTDLMQGMDRLGRLLFLFYWNNKAFSEKYGLDDMAELEETLTESFNIVGDLLLFLLRKSTSAESSLNSVTGDLSEDIGQ